MAVRVLECFNRPTNPPQHDNPSLKGGSPGVQAGALRFLDALHKRTNQLSSFSLTTRKTQTPGVRPSHPRC